MITKKQLFAAGSETPTTDVVEIPEAGCLTFVGFGLEEGDSFELEVVVVEAVKPDMSCCMPQVQMPAIKNSTPIMQGCTPLAITHCNNIVEVCSPKGFGIRAIRRGGNIGGELWYSVTGDK